MRHKIVRHSIVRSRLVEESMYADDAWKLIDEAREQRSLVDALIEELFFRLDALNLPEPSPLSDLPDEMSDLLLAYQDRLDLLKEIQGGDK